MTRAEGVIPRRELGLDLSEQETSTLCGNVWDVLIQLHSVDPEAAGLGDLGKGEGYVGRQVSGWTTRLDAARTDDMGDWSDITAWIAERQPADVRTCLIHNDFRFDNLVLTPTDPPRVTAVLDWEMATLGDPLMDLGGSMSYWVQDDDDEFFRQFRRQPSNAPGHVDPAAGRRPLLRADGLLGLRRAVAVLRGLRAVPARGHRAADLVPLLPPADHQRGVRRVRPGRRLPRAAGPLADRRLMGRILLVRHGQASWGAADYDVLSATGEQQAEVLGRALADLAPDVVVHGSLLRQQRTAEIAVAAAGWDTAPLLDARWNEMDHLAVLAAQPRDFDGEPDRHQFQAWFEAATTRWTSGSHDDDYAESFPAFRERVAAGLAELAEVDTAVVVTSGGPVSAVTADLLAAGLETYTRLAPVVVNTSVTTVVAGRRGLTLVAFNEHRHLAGELLTYR